jgi:hypothetical protein
MIMAKDNDKIADAYRHWRQAIGTDQEGAALAELNGAVYAAHFQHQMQHVLERAAQIGRGA